MGIDPVRSQWTASKSCRNGKH